MKPNGKNKDFKKKFEVKDKPTNKGTQMRHAFSCDDIVRESNNDIAWYSRNPQLLKDTASISYGDVLGLDVDIAGSYTPGGSYTLGNTKIPGIVKLSMLPCFGATKDGSSNVNTVARLIYSFVRHANSGSRNYEAPDYMTYLLAMSSAYAWHAEMVRLYGLFRVYNQRNRYVAKAMVTALGYDYDDINNHLSDLRYYINYFAVKLNAFAVPKSMTIYDRHAFIPLHVYKDSDQDKAQHYMMQFSHYWTWSGTAYDTGSALIATPATASTFDDIAAFGNGLINSLLTNEDIGIMSGDTLKAFGDDGVRHVLGIPEDYATVPVYDEMVLSQIHNASVGIVPAEVGSLDITQSNGNIVWNPRFLDSPVDYSQYNQVLDCGFNNPTPEYNMEATRLKVYTGDAQLIDSVGTVSVDTCGTEIVGVTTVYSMDEDGSASQVGLMSDHTRNDLILRPYFDWAPIIYANVVEGSKVTPYPIGDLFNYTLISKETLNKLHNTALWSLMEVPGMGKSI